MSSFKLMSRLDTKPSDIAPVEEQLEDDTSSTKCLTIIRYASQHVRTDTQSEASVRSAGIQCLYKQLPESGNSSHELPSFSKHTGHTRSHKKGLQNPLISRDDTSSLKSTTPLISPARKRQNRLGVIKKDKASRHRNTATVEASPSENCGPSNEQLNKKHEDFGPGVPHRHSLFSPLVPEDGYAGPGHKSEIYGQWERALQRASYFAEQERGANKRIGDASSSAWDSSPDPMQTQACESQESHEAGSISGKAPETSQKVSGTTAQHCWPSNRGRSIPAILPSAEEDSTMIVYTNSSARQLSGTSSAYQSDSYTAGSNVTTNHFSETPKSPQDPHESLVDTHLAGVIDVDLNEFRDTFYREYWVSHYDRPLPRNANSMNYAKYIRTNLPLVLGVVKAIAWMRSRLDELRASIDIIEVREICCVEKPHWRVSAFKEFMNSFTEECNQHVKKHSGMTLTEIVTEATKFKDILETSGKIGTVERMWYGRRITKTAHSIHNLLPNMCSVNIAVLQSAISIQRKYQECAEATRAKIRSTERFRKGRVEELIAFC